MLRQEASVGSDLDISMTAFLTDGHDCAIMVNADSPTLPTDFIFEAIACSARLATGSFSVPLWTAATTWSG